MIEAAIFDMDGLLVDSEPLWAQAEREVFGGMGVVLSEDQVSQTVGMGLVDVVRFYDRHYRFEDLSQEQIVARIHERVLELIRKEVQARPGAVQTIAYMRRKELKVGLATASDHALIEAALGRLGVLDQFDWIQSAVDLPYGKPNPEVYLLCARKLGVDPEKCVGFEDSLPGLIAIKAARMKAVVVPEKSLASDPRLALADVVLGSLVDLDDRIWSRISL